jgi:four helix bundle suffix protein
MNAYPIVENDGNHDSSHSQSLAEPLLPQRGDYQTLLSFQKAEVVYDITFRFANIAICLIHQANYLIDQQLKTLEKEFLEQGGLRERMTRLRLANRNSQGRK